MIFKIGKVFVVLDFCLMLCVYDLFDMVNKVVVIGYGDVFGFF